MIIEDLLRLMPSLADDMEGELRSEGGEMSKRSTIGEYAGLTTAEIDQRGEPYDRPLEVLAVDDETASRILDPAHPDFDAVAKFAAFLRSAPLSRQRAR